MARVTVSSTPTVRPEPVLIATKLHVPEPRPGMVDREELVTRLVAGADRKLTLVCAPAGWGKTMLLSEWRASPEEARSFAWVQLDPADDDPVRFWSYLIGALQRGEPELGRLALATLPSAGPGLVDAVLPPLLNDLGNLPRPVVLVLDDYHLVRNELVHASVGYFLRHLPRTVQLAIASRADPPLPLGSLRAAGEVTELRAAELCFSDAEADALLNGTLGLGLERDDIELLRERTEGWPAGLQLAALTLQAQEDKHAFVEAFHGDDRQIGDYLHEVLADQPHEVGEFLLRTSVLERLCGPLCDAVTGGKDGVTRLEQLYRQNLFLAALDGRGEWYRYHHLFGELLRHELRQQAGPELVAELHRRAYAWHLARGDVDDAIGHATKAGEVSHAAELIARHGRRMVNLGRAETVARWIDALPREFVLEDARLCLTRGWAALYVDDLDAAASYRQAAERAPLPGPLYEGFPSVAASAALLEASHANVTGDVGRGVEASRRAVSLSPTFGSAAVSLGVGLYDAGQYGEAARTLERGIGLLPVEGSTISMAYGLSNLAAAYADLGEVDRAERAATDAENLVDELALGEAPWVARTRVARARLLERRGDSAAAEAVFARAVVLARRGRRPLDLARALLLLARLRRRRDHADARYLAREARAVLAMCPDPGLLAELLARTERALQLTPARRSVAEPAADAELSERELAVLRLLAGELSQREIGGELYVSLNTVKGHTKSIFRKLGVSSRADAVARGRELGLL